VDLILLAAGRKEGSLVDEVPKVGSREPWRRRCELAEVYVTGEGHTPGMDLEDRLAAHLVGEVDYHAPVEAPRPKKCRIQHVGLVGCGQNDHALLGGEAIHLGEDLV
jgi:hypothetical protein